MKSMTGYGKGTARFQNVEISVELRAYNHRYLDISTKIPRAFLSFEESLKKELTRRFLRGHFDVFVNYDTAGESGKTASADLSLAKSVIAAAGTLNAAFPELKDDLTLTSLMRQSDILNYSIIESATEETGEKLLEAAKIAAEGVDVMRSAEGEKLKAFFTERLAIVETYVQKIKELAPVAANEMYARVKERIAELLSGVEVDEPRLLNEAAFLTDKACIDEELVRLDSHIAQARALLESSDAVGRKLDFLIQEFNREANTICSKSNNLAITNLGIELKNDIEKIREQAQNIE